MSGIVGKHDFYGACMPSQPGEQCVAESFSVGVFEWVPTANGNGTKRGKVKVRVRGKYPMAIKRRAKEICDELDVGAYNGPKTVTVWDRC